MSEILNITDIYKQNFLEYASYVIKERALPEIIDGLKPVQRRILYSLLEMDDGRFHKVANVIGHCMMYHPHGDAAIGDALVVLGNKEYFIEKQGNFGNPFTGDVASAPRYIECRLTPLAKEVLYNKEITPLIDSYDGRHKEPIVFPCKIPYILLHGTEGIAVGLSTKILPHNFNEVLQAQIAYLKGEPFEIYPDFFQGGIIDVSEYNDGAGKVKVRAKIDKVNNKTLIIKELPYGITSERLIASVEDAVRRNKVKLNSIRDFTTDHIEIELTAQRGVSAEELLERLFAYTDCEISISSNINLIIDRYPKTATITSIVQYSTDHLVEILKNELRIKIQKLKDRLHAKSLEQIFIENKIYKHIESAESYENAKNIIKKHIEPFLHTLEKDVVEDDIEALLEIPIKKIAKFDLQKNQEEILNNRSNISTEQDNLNNIKKYTIQFIQSLLKKYGNLYPRKSKIQKFEAINARDINDTDTKVYYDIKTGYIGTKVKGDSKIECSSFDKILLISQKGVLKIIPVPDKMFCDKLVHFDVINKDLVFNALSREKKSMNAYLKRFRVEKFIQNKEYSFLDDGHRLEGFTARNGMLVQVEYENNLKDKPATETFSTDDFPVRGPANRGTRLGSRKILRTKFIAPSFQGT